MKTRVGEKQNWGKTHWADTNQSGTWTCSVDIRLYQETIDTHCMLTYQQQKTHFQVPRDIYKDRFSLDS